MNDDANAFDGNVTISNSKRKHSYEYNNVLHPIDGGLGCYGMGVCVCVCARAFGVCIATELLYSAFNCWET